MKISYYGHACFAAEINGTHLLFDPFISGNPLAATIDIQAIKADYILLSHGHQDHVLDAIEIGMRCGATFVAGFEVYEWLQKQGVEKVMPMNHGGSWNLDFGSLKFVHAVHSSVLPDGTYGGNPGGFVVQTKIGNFYYSGDTALTLDMQLIPMTCAPLDFALMPIGDVFTMGIDDAIIACDFIKCNRVIGLHYDTFEPIKIDHEAAIKAFREKGKELILLKIGEQREIN